jgi:hypothetical protein
MTTASTSPNDSLRRVRAVATILDDAIRIPGTNLRIGLDPLVGLIPGLGDMLGGAASAYIILEAARAGAPASVLVRMALNVGVDAIVGSVPFLGDLFDFAWKSNRRNVHLLARHVEAPMRTGRASTALVVLLLTVIVALAAGLSLGMMYLLRRLLF